MSSRLTRWQRKPSPSLERIPALGEACLSALRHALRDDPEAFGLRRVMRSAGERLVDTLDALRTEGPAAIASLPANAPEERLELFHVEFVRQVAGSDGLVVDAVARHAAARCGATVVSGDNSLRDAVRQGARGGGSGNGPFVSGELFCEVYVLFFADIVQQFITTVIAEKIKLAVPALPIVDPAGLIAEWVGERVAELVPSPCEEKEARGDTEGSLAELARGLVAETVERVLGIPPGGERAA